MSWNAQWIRDFLGTTITRGCSKLVLVPEPPIAGRNTDLCRDRLRSNGNAEERRPEVQIRTSSRNELCLTHHLCQDYSAAFPANVATTGMF